MHLTATWHGAGSLAECSVMSVSPGVRLKEANVSEVATYSAVHALSDGRTIRIRALKPEDRSGLLEAVRRSSPQSLYRRFFGLKRQFSEEEIAYFLNVDFLNHVALIAEIEEDGRPTIVGGARLMRHLAEIGREAGLKAFTAEILPDNRAMLKVFQKSGFPLRIEHEPGA